MTDPGIDCLNSTKNYEKRNSQQLSDGTDLMKNGTI